MVNNVLVAITESWLASTKMGWLSGNNTGLVTIVELTAELKVVIGDLVSRETSSCTYPMPWALEAGFPGPLPYQKLRSESAE